MSTLNVSTIIPDAGTNTDLSLDGKGTGKVAVVDDATVGDTLAVTGHACVGAAGVTDATRALTVVGASDGSGSSILVGYNSSLASKFSVRDDGLTTIGDSLVFSTAAKGVYLGTTSATAANLLDDYEEGTWTAALVGTTANPSSAVTVTGDYTKIGNMCYVTAAFANVDTTGASGGVRVTGMPFTQSPANQMTGNCTLHTVASVGAGVSNISPFYQGSICDFYGTLSNAGWTAVTHNAGSGRYLYFTGFFKCA